MGGGSFVAEWLELEQLDARAAAEPQKDGTRESRKGLHEDGTGGNRESREGSSPGVYAGGRWPAESKTEQADGQ